MAQKQTNNDGNELVFVIVFVAIFIPPLVLLLLQLYRAFVFQRERGTSNSLFWIDVKEIGAIRLNMHLLVKLAFTIICFARILQGLLFGWVVLSPRDENAMDNAVRYWIPYIAMNFMFTALSLLLYYWVELGLSAVYQLGKERLIPKKVTWFFVAINIVFHVLTLILLGIFVKPNYKSTELYGTPETKMLKEIYFFTVNLPMLFLCCGSIWFVKYVMRRLEEKLGPEAVQQIHVFIAHAHKKIGRFIVASVIAFTIRILCDFIVIYFSFSTDVQATLIFLWNSIPEIVLSVTLAILMWIPASSIKAASYERLTAAELIAPEAYRSRGTELESSHM